MTGGNPGVISGDPTAGEDGIMSKLNGYFPARQIAKLSPSDVMRVE
jgi:hypothetical protein